MFNRNDGFNGKLKALLPYLLIAVVGVSAYFLTKLAIPEPTSITRAETGVPVRSSYPEREEEVLKNKKTERGKSGALDFSAIDNGAIPNQRIVVFKDKAALDAFLAKMGDGVSILGRLDRLNALLIGFTNESDLTALLDGTEETAFNFPASLPEFESVGPQDGAVPLGSDLLRWLGIEGDNSLWGKGFRIAIIDTGIADHLVFKNAIERINIIPLPEDLANQNGHGTGVATPIFSDHPFAPGVAPAAIPISIRAANDDGSSNTFLLVQALEAAIKAKADYINFSLGGQGKSALFERLIDDAISQGIVIVAAAGNTGKEGVLYPGAFRNVITFGAVDAQSQPMAYSTTGREVAAAAPGYGVNVAFPNGKAAQVSGTSFSAPIGIGVMAGIGSNAGSPRMTPRQSADHFLANLHDIGVQGFDKQSGGGVPNAGTMIYPKQYDASVNSITISRGKNGSLAQVMVQNVGTQRLLNSGVTVNVNGVATSVNITTLAPMESRVVSIPVSTTESLNIQGSVQASGGQIDQRPSNNSLSQSISATAP